MINCVGSGKGLQFVRVCRVRIERVVLVGCGFQRSHGNSLGMFWTSIFVFESSEFRMEGVVVSEAKGKGVWLVDTKKSNISNYVIERDEERDVTMETVGIAIEISQNNSEHYITNCHFVSSDNETTPQLHHDDITQGGRISVSLLNWSHDNHVTISDCVFRGSTAREGGAVHISIQDMSSNNTITIARSEFTANAATEGGGAISANFLPSLRYATPPQGNQLRIVECNFTGNKATKGGGLQLVFTPKTSCTERGNKVELIDSSWTENEAHHGAAIDMRPVQGAQLSSGSSNPTPLVMLRDCNLEHNVAKWRKSNSLHWRGEGSVRAQNTQLTIEGYLNVINNTGSALYLESSRVRFRQDSISTFAENQGYQGAAIALMGQGSVIVVYDNSTVLFQGNEADDYGGAIYQEHSWSCFVEKQKTVKEDHRMVKEDNTSGTEEHKANTGVDKLESGTSARLEFDNNTCYDRGHAVFVSSLRPCLQKQKTQNYLETLNEIANITILDNNSTKQIATLGSELHSEPLLSAIPGKETALKVWMTDDTNSHTLPYFQISWSNPNASVAMGYTYKGHKGLKFSGRPGSIVQLEISPTHMLEVKLRMSVTLTECPPGYYYDDNNNTCLCSGNSRDDRKRYIGIHSCDLVQFRATLLHSYWAGYVADANNQTTLMTSFCPKGFCARSQKEQKDILLPPIVSDHDLSSYVCRKNRTGMLCARCRQNYSVFFPTFHLCRRNNRCELGWLFYILSQLLPTTLLFFLIIALDINLTSGAFGSVIFYIQSFDLLIITGNDFLWYDPPVYTIINGLRLISRTANLRFFARPETAFCIFEGATSLDAIAMNYVTYIYALLLVVFTVKCLKPCLHWLRVQFSRRAHRDQTRGAPVAGAAQVAGKLSHSIIHGLLGFLVLCYSQSTYIGLHLVSHNQLYGMGRKSSENLVFYNGELRFFKGKHLAYALPATFFLVIITIIPPLLLLSYPLCYKVLALCNLQESKFAKILCIAIPLEKYKPLFDSFQGSFKDEHRYFAGLFFLYRLVMLLTLAYVRVVATFYVILEIEFAIMLALHAWVQPHRRNWHNRLDEFVFLLLLVVNGCSIYLYHQRADYSYRTAYVTIIGTFQVLITCLPHLYAVVYVLVQVVRCVRGKWRGRGRGRGRRGEERLDTGNQLEEVLLSRASEVNTSLLSQTQ